MERNNIVVNINDLYAFIDKTLEKAYSRVPNFI